MWQRIVDLTSRWIDKTIEINEIFEFEDTKINLQTIDFNDVTRARLRFSVNDSNLSVNKFRIGFTDKTGMNFMCSDNRIESHFYKDWLSIFKHKTVVIGRTCGKNHLSFNDLKFLEPKELYYWIPDIITIEQMFDICKKSTINLSCCYLSMFQNLDRLQNHEITLMDVISRPNSCIVYEFLLKMNSSNKLTLHLNEILEVDEVERIKTYYEWCKPKCQFKIRYLRSNESQNDIVNLERTKFSENRFQNVQYPLANINICNLIKEFL